MNEQATVSPFSETKADLERQLERLEQKRQAVASALEGVVEAERRLAALAGGEAGAIASIAGTGRPVPSPANNDLAGKRYQVIARMLREIGRPMTVPELARELMRRGDPNSMNSLRDIVHAICRRKTDIFVKLRVNGQVLWWLAGVATPTSSLLDHAPDAGPHRNGHATHAPDTAPHSAIGNLAGKTIAGAARIVLTDHHNAPMHFEALADEMKQRGYRSGRSAGLPPASVATVLNATSDEFENMGGGKFRLRET